MGKPNRALDSTHDIVSARVSRELVDQLEKEAKEAGISRSALVAQLIREATKPKRPVPGPLTPLSAFGPVTRRSSTDRAEFLMGQLSIVVSDLEVEDLEGAGMIVDRIIAACEDWFGMRSTPTDRIKQLIDRVAAIADAGGTIDERAKRYGVAMAELKQQVQALKVVHNA